MVDLAQSTDLPHLTRSESLNRPSEESGVFSQFLQSAVYAGAEAPIRGVAQIADHVGSQVTGGKADATVQQAFKAIGVEAPKQAEFGSKNWYAQQLGGAVGMVVPFLALRAGINSGAGRLFGAAALEAPTQTFLQMATREAALSGATGLVYGTIFSPSNESNVGSNSFLADRAKAGLGDMASFAALGFAAPYIGLGFDAAARSLERTSMAMAPKSAISAALRFPLLPGMAAGVPGGIVNAEVNAWKDGRLFASSQELKESIVGMAFVGGAMGTASWVVDRAFNNKNHADAHAHTKEKIELKEQTSAKESQAPKTALSKAEQEMALTRAIEDVIRRLQEKNGLANDSLTPENILLEKMAESTVKRNGVATTREVPQEKAQAPKVSDKIKPVDPHLPGLDIVLGASGIEAPAHAGFLKAIEDSKVPVRTITGASGGSLVAALYANKYSPAQIKEILLSDQFRYPKMSVIAESLHLADPWNLYPYSIDFKPWVKDFVETYNLKPQPNLRIVAADSKTRAPVVFEGTNYDLTTALTASTASTIGMNMKPVIYQGRELIDGFYYHPTPAALTKAPSIVSKIGFVSKLPSEPLLPWDYYMHLRELSYHNELTKKYPDPKGHIISETGLPDVATTAFGVSRETLERLVKHGYDSTMERLKQPDAQKAISDAQKSVQKVEGTQKK